VANVREHAGTGQRPSERFVEELKALSSLPAHPYLPIKVISTVLDNKALTTWPIEHLQHPLSTYDRLYQEAQ